ncbi:MAG TPA: hypothetical protein VES96_06165 [Nitrospiraceae bacterium]|nr:hypothetical protein [Nitrospiraceae bacterium]
MRALPSSCITLLTGASLLLSGCASILHSDHQSVRIFSEPGEAKVVVDDRFHLTTVGTVNLSRFSDHTAVFEKEGYEPVTVTIERHMSKQVWWNLWCLPAIYWCLKSDREDGGFWTFDDDIYVTLTKRADAAPAKPPAP